MVWTKRRLKKLVCISKQEGKEFSLNQASQKRKPVYTIRKPTINQTCWMTETTSYSWRKDKEKEKNKEEYMLQQGIKLWAMKDKTLTEIWNALFRLNKDLKVSNSYFKKGLWEKIPILSKNRYNSR